MMARIGERRHRITIQEKGTPARDAAGGEVITWADVVTCWAKEVPYSGREFMSSAREYAERHTRFSIRYRSGVLPTMRISYDSRIFEIFRIINVNGRSVELLLMVKEEIES